MKQLDPAERYQRNFNSLSGEDQKKLKGSRVIILGLGGLGGGVLESLARIGVGQLTLVDGDVFEVSNLNRQLLSRESLIGFSKASAAAARVEQINSGVNTKAADTYLETEQDFYDCIEGHDVAVDCLDTIDARFRLEAAAKKAGIPVVSGAIAGMTGQVTVIFPGDGGFTLIYGDRDQISSRGIEEAAGNISCCALLTASLQASEVVKVLLKRGNILRNKLFISDLWTNSFEVVELCG